MATTKYLVAGILVEAVKSEGGGFYDLTVIATGDRQRYLADVFETVAIPVTTTGHKYVTHSTYTGEGCAMCGQPEGVHEVKKK